MRRKETIEEKIEYVKNKIKNLNGNKIEEIRKFFEDNPNNTKTSCVNFIKSGWKSSGILTKQYWIQRGWPEAVAKFKSKEQRLLKPKRLSPFDYKFYLEKDNPNTKEKYTIEEAKYKANSNRPIKKEYWLKRGFVDCDAILKAKEVKDKNNKKGAQSAGDLSTEEHKIKSPRCKEYYLMRGHTELEAELLIRNIQATFTLQKCIEKHGEVNGYKIWKERQKNWQNTLNNKTQEELDEISRKKRVRTNTHNNKKSILYIIDIFYPSISKSYYKIGVTSNKVLKRYEYEIKCGIEVKEIYSKEIKTFSKAIHYESEIINNFHKMIQVDHMLTGYTECFDKDKISLNELTNYIEDLCK